MDQEFWNDSYRDDPHHTVVPDRMLANEVSGLIPGRALDLGCGTGPNALMLAEEGWSVLGIDWSEQAVRLANEAAAQRGLDARFVVADTTVWQPQDTFDLVIITYALPGGEATGQVLRTAARALAAGGTLMVAEWDPSMAELWNFDADDMVSAEQIIDLLPGLEIEHAGVHHVPDMFAADDPRGYAGPAANVLLVRATRPS